MTERWQPVPGHEHRYEISDRGNLRTTAGSPMSTWITKPGYRYIHLRRDDGTRPSYRVARLVARVFLGEPRGARSSVNHRDGDKANDRLENLEWVSQGENNHHARVVLGKRLGQKRGADHTGAKLTEAQARQIKVSAEAAWRLAERFGVSETTIYLIREGKRWVWL